MTNFLMYLLFILLQFFPTQDTYKKNLDTAVTLFVQKEDIPETVLLDLVPESQEEMSLYFQTTSPEYSIKNSGFFYKTSIYIFQQYTVDEKEQFYLPAIQLASFADGEFGEPFVEQLEKIVKKDPNKFCLAVKDQDYANRNPVKYYIEEYCND